MNRIIDITGQRFTRLIAIEPAGKSNGQITWLCRCDCGKQTIVRSSELRSEKTRSCGCLSREISRQKAFKHGHSSCGGKIERSPTYSCWQTMRQRCNDLKHPRYHRYGGRGIRICDYWDKFENFLEDMGERQAGKSLDRINNDGHYVPSNCRWITIQEQQRNRVDNVWVTAFGETKLLVDWSRDARCSVGEGQISKRLKAGWTPEQAISARSTFISEKAKCLNCDRVFTRIRAWQYACSRHCSSEYARKRATGTIVAQQTAL